jgi:Putative DNA-binding domain
LARDEITLSDLAEELGERSRVSYRLMLRRSDKTWTLQAMMVDAAGQAHPSFVYDYGHVAFLSGTTTGSRVSKWLLKLKGKVGDFKFVVPKLQENVFSDRYPSHISRDIFLALPQPFSIHRIHISERTEYRHDLQPLVKAECPSFRDLAEAATQLLYGLHHVRGNREPEDIVVRVAHTEAWIELVHLRQSAVSITVAGTRVSGTRLEVRTEPLERFEQKLRKAGVRRYSFPRGLPPQLFAILSRGDRWLDYRDLDLRGNTESVGKNVIVDPADDCAQIEGLIDRGESETREFKREISNEKKTTFLKTVAGFANVSGGVILFGVVNGTGEIVGVNGDVNKEKDRIINMVRDTVVPQPSLRITSCQIKGKQVIALFIEEGDSPPYGLYPDKPVFYVRRGATTFPANQADIRAFTRKNESRSDAYPYGLSRMY